jgi:hypothetical protein
MRLGKLKGYKACPNTNLTATFDRSAENRTKLPYGNDQPEGVQIWPLILQELSLLETQPIALASLKWARFSPPLSHEKEDRKSTKM